MLFYFGWTRRWERNITTTDNTKVTLHNAVQQLLVPPLLIWTLLISGRSQNGVDAVVPTLTLDILANENTLLVQRMMLSQSLFGPVPKQQQQPWKNRSISTTTSTYTLTYPPDDTTNGLLCETNSSSVASDQVLLPPNSILLVPRGVCTFQTKVIQAQKLGAAAVLIYGTLASRYTLNATSTTSSSRSSSNEKEIQSVVSDATGTIVYPLDKYDYDCNNGETWIDTKQLSVDWTQNPAVLVNSYTIHQEINNLCLHQIKNPTQCNSQSFLLTGNVSATNTWQVCCAWDLSIWLYPDTTTETMDPIRIPSAYMTMRQFSDLIQIQSTYDSIPYNNNNSNPTVLTASLYARWRPSYNPSAMLIWLLGTVVATIAAYTSASDYHTKITKVIQEQHEQRPDSNTATTGQSHENQTRSNTVGGDEILELTAVHAALFVVMASTSLLVLFYFKIYGIVKIFYALGCSTAMTQVLLEPLYRTIALHWTKGQQQPLRQVVIWSHEEIGDITVMDIVTYSIGYTIGLSWLVVAFTVRDAENLFFFWILQDIFGSCMCIMFLRTIRLNSIRVASILLIVAFFYDIFFVFVTPYLFSGKSVMITVATSGGPPKADALWCEKYPNDKDCQGGNPLPMLLAIPRLFDFTGGSSMLGLGDIVLPGLLLSFAARFDAAKRLLGVMGGGRGGTHLQTYCPEQQCCTVSTCCSGLLCNGGYFAPLVLAYAVGLAMANTAVYVMQMGQPALLYLVPCCLGTMSYIGWRRNELQQLWDGPRVLRTADDVVFGIVTSTNQHVPLALEEEAMAADALTAPPSAVE